MEKLKTHRVVYAYPDFPEGGSYCGIVLAPDDQTRDQMIAAEILKDNEWDLGDQGYDTLTEMIDDFSIVDEWEDLKGHACPNCCSHSTSVISSEIAAEMHIPHAQASNARICESCAYVWIPLGMHTTSRNRLEEEARKTIAGLNGVEMGDDEGESAHHLSAAA